ncbi:DUF1697 domain-containing protein [Caldilinea sp.]|uniref:DUF1697 domain-containing protein n=1 Tax=Caldilinea sp. TaxID=2293560 RepID=UPI002B97E3F1|nr:DUF1697 domain-containing protein [Caldilinea sp.]
MNTYIVLLRGINVGGKHVLPMKALTALLETLGAQQVSTYIQSGNVVLQHAMTDAAALGQRITAAIEQGHGFAPHVLVLERAAFAQAMARNPFPDAAAAPATLHLGFLDAPPPQPDLAKLARLRQASERFQLLDRVFYLHAPEGVGRSKLAAGAEKALGVPMTDRNWRTVEKIWALAGKAAG